MNDASTAHPEPSLPPAGAPPGGGTAEAPIEVLSLPLGPLDTNCYVLFRRGFNQAVVFDPGGDPTALLALLAKHDLQVAALALTHGHGDHLGGVEQLLTHLHPPPPYYAPAREKDFLRRALVNLSAWIGQSVTTRPADVWLNGGETVTLAGIPFQVHHTPGHTPGHLIYVCAGGAGRPPIVIAGDLIFRESVGRTDFPGGSFDQLAASIQKHIWPLPDAAVLYPGHGPATTVGHEKQHNPFVPLKGKG
ncbi:MAG: MBL fold metallo-hydrolase [Planctomycetota bacterium]